MADGYPPVTIKDWIPGIVVAVSIEVGYRIFEWTTKSWKYAILGSLCLLIILTIVLAYRNAKQRRAEFMREMELIRKQMQLIGIKEIYASFSDAPASQEIIKDATNSIEFLGISAKTFFEARDIEEVVKRKRQRGVSFEFLLLNPDSKYAIDRARKEVGAPTEEWKHDIVTDIEKIKRLRTATKSYSGRIGITLYDAVPIWRAIFVDDKRALISYYPHGFTGKECPFSLVEKSETSLYDPVRDLFRDLLQRGQPVPE